MPFDDAILVDGKAVTAMIMQRQDRQEMKIDALQIAQAAQGAQVAQVLHIVEQLQSGQKGDDTNVTKIEISRGSGFFLTFVIAIAVIGFLFFIYGGGSFGG